MGPMKWTAIQESALKTNLNVKMDVVYRKDGNLILFIYHYYNNNRLKINIFLFLGYVTDSLQIVQMDLMKLVMNGNVPLPSLSAIMVAVYLYRGIVIKIAIA